MEKDVRFWSTFIMCAGCKRKNHAFEAFFQEGKKNVSLSCAVNALRFTTKEN